MVCDSHVVIHIPSEMLSKHMACSHVILHADTQTHNALELMINIHTHQDFTAVTKPAAAVLPGQDEGEGLTVNTTSEHRRRNLLNLTFHCLKTSNHNCEMSIIACIETEKKNCLGNYFIITTNLYKHCS